MSSLKIENKNHVYTISLNKPEVRNAFSPAMIQDLTNIFLELKNNQELKNNIRVVVLQGEGTVFCAGADLNWMKSMQNYSFEQNQLDAENLFAMFAAISVCPLPIIAKVQKAAFGGALGLMACCDVVITHAEAQLCFSEVRLGIAPAVISHFILQKISMGQVLPYMISAQIFNPQVALTWGFVHEVVSRNELELTTQKWIQSFLSVGPQAAQETKKLLKNLNEVNVSEHKKITTQCIAQLRVSAEGQEGLKSFLEKRKPSYEFGE